MNKIIPYPAILLTACLLLSACSAPQPHQTLTAPPSPTGASSGRVVWEKEVPASSPALSDGELLSKLNRSMDPNTSTAEKARLMKSIMNSSNHVEGVIKQ